MRRALLTASLIPIAAVGGANVAHAQRTVSRPSTVLRRPTPLPSPHPTTPTPAPAPTPAPTPAPAAGGVYRVTLTGFHVNHETYDTALETDGKGDEIRIMTTVEDIDANGRSTKPPRTLSTPVYGDVNNFPSRVQAGSRSGKGGLRTGDSYPSGGATAPLQGAPLTDRIPMLLWQGMLQPGAGGVAIAPVAWEIDEGDVLTSLFPEEVSILHVVSGITSVLGGPAGAASNMVVQSADRPIGVVHYKAGGVDQLRFTPRVLTLTSTTAEAVIAGKGGAIAPGLVEVRYRDPASDLQGDYSIYLRIERMP